MDSNYPSVLQNCYEMSGDILVMKDVFICHQCNCRSNGSVAGLAEQVFKKWPQCNTYKVNIQRTPGSVDIFRFDEGGGVVNLYAQKGYGDLSNSIERPKRLEWFRACLEELAFIGPSATLAFPHMIDCGLAGGDWAEYKDAIKDFAARNRHLKVVIVKKNKSRVY